MFGEAEKRVRVLVPGALIDAHYVGGVEGDFHSATGVLNVYGAMSGDGLSALALPPTADAVRGRYEVYESAENTPFAAQLAQDGEGLSARERRLRALRMLRGEEPAKASQPRQDAASGVLMQNDAPPEAPAFSAAPAQREAEQPLDLCLYWEGDELKAAVSSRASARVERYDLHRDIFSRNTGILETDFMAEKRAIVLGCGSVGSLASLELARAGVGHFLLVDTDVMEYHNICRHQCGVADVGRYKVDALRERILNINPAAEVEVARTTAERLPKAVFDAWCVPDETLILGCADNRGADVYANRIGVIYGVPFLSIGFWERAFAGELFYWLPGGNQPCYECALGSGALAQQRVEANHHVYTSQEDLEAVNFEPGISADINFVTTVGVKLALDILNRDNPRFTQRLLPNLAQYTLVCNTNNPAVGGPMAEIFSYPLQVTTSLKVGFGSGCPPCRYEGAR